MKELKPPSPFDIARHLWSDTRYAWEAFASVYNPFMVNRILSKHPDTIGLAHQMNRASGLSRREQYDFYFFSIVKKHRSVEYVSDVAEPDIEAVSRRYGVTKEVARDYLRIPGVVDTINK